MIDVWMQCFPSQLSAVSMVHLGAVETVLLEVLILLSSVSHHSHCVHGPVLFSELFFSVFFAAASYFAYCLVVVF